MPLISGVGGMSCEGHVHAHTASSWTCCCCVAFRSWWRLRHCWASRSSSAWRSSCWVQCTIAYGQFLQPRCGPHVVALRGIGWYVSIAQVFLMCQPACLWTCVRGPCSLCMYVLQNVWYKMLPAPSLTRGTEMTLQPLAPGTTTNIPYLLRHLTCKHRASVSGPPSGAQVGVSVLVFTVVLFICIRLDKIQLHPIFNFEPAAAPLDPPSTLPANPPQSTGV